MAATINASSSSGIVTTADNSAQLELQTASTTRLTINSSGNVGIGTASPTVKLEVNSASNPEMRINDGTVNLQLYAGTGTSSAVIGTVGSHALVFRTNATERMRIDSSGNVGIGTTTTAGGKTTIQTTSAAAPGGVALLLSDSTGSSANQFGIAFNSAAAGNAGSSRLNYYVDAGGATAGLTFLTGGATPTERMRISSTGGLSVGTTSDPGAGAIYATGNITAFFSDARLKDFKGTIPNALAKVQLLNGYYFTENEKAKELGYTNDKIQVGVSAQEVEAVLPEIVTEAPISAEYKTVYYDKLIPLLIEAIKELKAEVEELKKSK